MQMFSLATSLRALSLGLLLYMPFSLFFSRWLSLYTGGLGAWDAAKDIVTALAALIALLIFIQQKLYRTSRYASIVLAISAAYLILHLVFLLTTDNDVRSTIVATLYNGRVFAYLFIGLVAATVSKVDIQKYQKLIIIVALITAVFALAQYVLPKDLMTHFGYSIARGAKPAFFIDDKPDLPRVMSTVRDPNSYGAYLIVPILLLAGIILSKTRRLRKNIPAIALLGLALYLTFSRGAWLAAVCVTVMLVWWRYRGMTVWAARHGWAIVVALVFVFCISMYIIRNTTFYQGVIIHATSQDSPADRNSNGYHVEFARQGIMGIAAQPYGHGPGTAGLASIQDPAGSFLTENYFIQIGYEVGLIGLAVCIAIHAWLYGQIILSAHRLRGVLLVTFWGYVIMNMLFHMWSNEAVAAQWWLLAGAVAALPATAATRVTSQ